MPPFFYFNPNAANNSSSDLSARYEAVVDMSL